MVSKNYGHDGIELAIFLTENTLVMAIKHYFLHIVHSSYSSYRCYITYQKARIELPTECYKDDIYIQDSKVYLSTIYHSYLRQGLLRVAGDYLRLGSGARSLPKRQS